MSFAKPEKKNDHVNEDDKLYCSHPGCPNLWSVRMEGSPPKCSHHQWGAKPKHEGTSTYKQWSDRQTLSKPVVDWYNQSGEKW
jgi:hypothetical protein